MIPSVGVRHRASAPVSSSIAFVSQTNGGAQSTNTVTIAAPSGIVAGNLLYAMAVCDELVTNTPTLACPGWTMDAFRNYTNSNNSGFIIGFYKIATSSEPSSYTFSGANDDAMSIGIVNISGVNQTTPLAATTVTGQGTSSATCAFPSITLPHTCGILLAACQGGNFNSTVSNSFTRPSGYTGIVDSISQYNQQAVQDAESIFGSLKAAQGTGVVSGVTGTFSKANRYGTLVIALNPASYT